MSPEDHRRHYREAHAAAEKQHHIRVAEAEREFANDILAANTLRKSAAPKCYASSDSSNGQFQCGDSKAIEAAETAYRKAYAAAEKKRLRAIEKSTETCGNELHAAKIEFRHSPGWQGFYL